MSQFGLERTKLIMMILLSSPWKLHGYNHRGSKTDAFVTEAKVLEKKLQLKGAVFLLLHGG